MFNVGDRCLVQHLESKAGQLLNGQHVTLVKAIIQNGRFKCKCVDGSFKQIKPCNLQIIRDDRGNPAMVNNNQTQHQQQPDNSDSMKIESTNSGGNDDTLHPRPRLNQKMFFMKI